MPVLLFRERLREKRRSGAIVGVGVVAPVGVELDLAVVEVEDRRVREVAIGIRIIVSVHPGHQTSSFTSCWKQDYMLPVLNLIRQHLHNEQNLSWAETSSISSTQHALGSRNLHDSGCYR